MSRKVFNKKNIVMYAILIFGLLIVVYPFFFMLMNSIKTGPEIVNNPTALPTSLNINGYIEIFKSLNMGNLFINSIFISANVTFLNVVLSSMTAYGLVKTKLPFKDRILDIILASMMVPGVLLLIPSYCMLYSWDWINTYRVLIIPFCLSPFNIFLMVQFLRQVDNSYLEAARIDGANELQIFLKVILPMSKPIIATLTILTFMGSWNDFLNPLLYLRGESHMTVQLAVYKFQTAIPGVHAEQLWAAITIVTVPIVIVYLFMQKNFMKAFGGVGLK